MNPTTAQALRCRDAEFAFLAGSAARATLTGHGRKTQCSAKKPWRIDASMPFLGPWLGQRHAPRSPARDPEINSQRIRAQAHRCNDVISGPWLGQRHAPRSPARDAEPDIQRKNRGTSMQACRFWVPGWVSGTRHAHQPGTQKSIRSESERNGSRFGI